MSIIVRDSSCEAYTRELAGGIAALLRGGDAVTLSGGLGAGKTTFTRALVAGLGGDPRQVSSPTFVVVNQYDLPGGRHSARCVAHVDAYRLDSDAELDSLGWDRYFEGGRPRGDVIAVIEWPDRLGAERPADALEITIETTGLTSRRITITVPESWESRGGILLLAEREPARCRVTGTWIGPMHPTYPFADERARDADLHRWFSGEYRISRDVTAEDIEGDPGP